MRVLHGAWDGADGLVVWAEDAALPPCTGGRGADRTDGADGADGSARQAPPQHPYALSADALGALLTGLGAHRGDPQERRVHLPGSDAHPLPSPALGTLPDRKSVV